MENSQNILTKLIEWTEKPVPGFFKTLTPEQHQELLEYVHHVIDYETDGLDELYHTISSLIKYVPNFVLLPLITKFIKPPIAAGVCAKLSVKQASKIASDLPAEYLGEVALHMDSKLAAEILEELKPKLAEECIEYEGSHHPMKTLDIGQHVSDRLLKSASKYLYLLENVDDVLLETYKDVIQKLRAV
ncbi:MAG: hypothetical protein HQM12_09275 [SAR324 cluster bacterium]|nr:hypothetical protein [SAR324 cluster bacterium]